MFNHGCFSNNASVANQDHYHWVIRKGMEIRESHVGKDEVKNIPADDIILYVENPTWEKSLELINE